MKYLPFQCPYEKISCLYVDTLTSTLDQDCRTCEHYHNGVRKTGDMPVLEAIFNFFKKIINMEEEEIENILNNGN